MVRKRRKSSPIAHTEAHRANNARLAELGNTLRAKYESVADEAIPERLQWLVETLRAKEEADKDPS